MARTSTNKTTVKVLMGPKDKQQEQDIKVTWEYKTPPEMWKIETLRSFMFQGLSAATRAMLKSDVQAQAPALELYKAVAPMIEGLLAAGRSDLVNDFIALQKASGKPVQDKLQTHFVMSEEMYTAENPVLVYGEIKAETETETEVEVKEEEEEEEEENTDSE